MKYKRLGVNDNTTNVRFRCGLVKFLIENETNRSEDFFCWQLLEKSSKRLQIFNIRALWNDF